MDANRILIVGGGVAGLAMAHGLGKAGAGARVRLLEAEGGFGHHSSGKNAAILRTAIDAPATRRLALESARRLRDSTPDVARVPLLNEVGLLVAEGSPTSTAPPWLPDHLDAGEVRSIDPAELELLAPHWRPAGSRIWQFPGQGVLDVAALLDGLVASARASGVELTTGSKVRGLLRADEQVRGITLESGEEIEAATVVLAAGAWAGLLGAPLEARLTRRHLLVTRPDPRVDPRWPVVWDDAAPMYARPESGGMLVCACDQTDVHPDHLVADPEVTDAVALAVMRHLPSFADAGVSHCWPGLRTITADDTPVIGPDPRLGGLFWMAGLGGHGMTIALAIADLAADLLLGREVDEDLRAAVNPGRFTLPTHA